MAAAALTGVLAVLAAFQLSFPDRDRRWALLPLPALALWLGDLGWGCLQGFARLGAEGLRLTTSFPCLAFILGFGLTLTHHLDAAAMVLAWHGLAIAVTTATAALLGPKVMRAAEG